MAKNMNGLSREFIIHPGETLKEVLEDRNMSQKELAIRTDVTESHVSSVVNCQKAISVSYAKKLEYALSIDAGFWVNLQANYDKELADFEEVNGISDQELEILKRLNSIVKHLKTIGMLEPGAYGPILVIHLRKLLNVSSLTRIPELAQTGAYRLATATNVDPYVLFTWLRMCDLMALGQETERELDIGRLKDKIPLIKELMFGDVIDVQPRLKTYLAECGIKFSIVKNFRGAPVQGVIKKNDDGTLSLLITTRRKFADIFWFTFFHEIGHIMNGDIEDKLVDYDFAKGEIEDRADKFATNTLIDPKAYKEFVAKKDFTLTSIQRFSAQQNIPTYILIGRLQRDGHVGYHQYSGEKVKYVLREG
jgi:HTH-type transcriptional regulator/antitoxin HigA